MKVMTVLSHFYQGTSSHLGGMFYKTDGSTSAGNKLCLHVYFSKAHPWDRRYSARIKTSNVCNTWAPVNPIIQGTSCAGWPLPLVFWGLSLWGRFTLTKHLFLCICDRYQPKKISKVNCLNLNVYFNRDKKISSDMVVAPPPKLFTLLILLTLMTLLKMLPQWNISLNIFLLDTILQHYGDLSRNIDHYM